MRRILTVSYGLFAYSGFLACYVYLLLFLHGDWVPTTVDGNATMAWPGALAIDVTLLALFGIQHTVMARPGFKARFTRWVPQSIERSTYVLLSSLLIALLIALWQPIDAPVWSIDATLGQAVLRGLFWTGAALIPVATFAIDHFELFGLRQVVQAARRREHVPPAFRVCSFYRLVRHPLYIGWMLTFWATPLMTVGHLVLAITWTAYILIAVRFEERDLVATHGPLYQEYRRRVPMLLPWRGVTPQID